MSGQTLIPLRDLLGDEDRKRLELELAANARSSHQLASCLTKRQYANQELAARAAKDARRRTGHRITPYHCRYCWAFHIGHSRPDWRTQGEKQP